MIVRILLPLSYTLYESLSAKQGIWIEIRLNFFSAADEYKTRAYL